MPLLWHLFLHFKRIFVILTTRWTKVKKINKEEKTIIKQTNEDTNMVRKFFLILIGVILISVLIYFLTTKTLSDSSKANTESTNASITYDTINVGNIFNRPYEEYYVMAYDFNGENAGDYTNAVLTYKNESTSIKIYSLDLSLKQNNSHVGDKSNKTAKTAEEIMFNGPTLIKIKDGKIKNYYDSQDTILEVLK